MNKYKKYLGKKVFLKTSYGRYCTIDVEEVTDTTMSGMDKFNEPIDIALDDIASISVDSIMKKKW